MSRIMYLMKELNLKDEIIVSTLNKIENVCRNNEIKPSRHYSFYMGGNGDGDGDN